MSAENYSKAVAIMEANKEKCFFVGPRSDELIALAEETLGVHIEGFYRQFLNSYGAGSFGSQEVYGVIDDDFEKSSVPDGIWFTLTERREVDLPKQLLVIYDAGNGELYCLDLSEYDTQQEPTVVSFVPGVRNQQYELIAHDFADFLFELVRHEAELISHQ